MELDLDWRRVASQVWPDVSYELRPLRVWAFRELLAFWEGTGGEADSADPALRLPPLEGLRLMELAGRILPDHIRGLDGITVTLDGQRSTPQVGDLCEETRLIPLASEMVARLVEISQLTGTDEKN